MAPSATKAQFRELAGNSEASSFRGGQQQRSPKSSDDVSCRGCCSADSCTQNSLDLGTDSRVYNISMMTNGCLRSGELAHLAGVSTDTLRHYERKGLLLARRSPNGYREFPPDALARVRLIQHALSVGFALDELASFLKVRDQGGAPCRQVRTLASKKLQDLDERITALTALRGDLRSILEDWDTRLARTKNGGRAWLLESLAAGSTMKKRNHNDLGGRK